MATQSRPLLITRPQAQAEAFAAALEAAQPGRWDPVIAPLLTIEPTGAKVDTDGIEAVIFTSANAVSGMTSPGKNLPALCVGPATTRAAAEAGFDAYMVAGDVQGLIEALTAGDHRGPLLHLRGRYTTLDLVEALKDTGVELRSAVVYDQVAQPLPEGVREAIRTGTIADVTLFSRRTAQVFAAQLALPPGLRCHCLSKAVAEALPEGPTLRVAPSPDREGMLSLLRAQE